MAVTTQHFVRLMQSGPPAFMICAAWGDEDSTKSESWLILPELNSQARHTYSRFFNAAPKTDEQELLLVARRAAELDAWKVIRSAQPAWTPLDLILEDALPSDIKAWRSLAEYPGLTTLVRMTYCPELPAVVRAMPRGHARFFTESSEYPNEQ